MRKDRIIVSGEDIGREIMRIGNKTYFVEKVNYQKDGHIKNVIFISQDEKQREKEIENITEKIYKVADKKEILRNALRKCTVEELRKFKDELVKGIKPKEKHGCYGIQIGKRELTIIE